MTRHPLLLTLFGLGVAVSAAAGQGKKNKPNEDLSAEVKAMLADLHGKDVRKRIIAAQDLGKLGEAAPFTVKRDLCTAMIDPSPKVAAAAIGSFEKVDPKLHRPVSRIILNRSFSDNDLLLILDSLGEIAAMRENAQPAEFFLSRFVGRSAGLDFRIPNTAMVTLSQIKPREESSVNALAAQMLPGNQGDERVRNTAIKMLYDAVSNWGGDEKSKTVMRNKAYQHFKRSMADPNAVCASSAIANVGNYGADASDSLPTLRKLKLHKSELVRDAANAAIARIAPDK